MSYLDKFYTFDKKGPVIQMVVEYPYTIRMLLHAVRHARKIFGEEIFPITVAARGGQLFCLVSLKDTSLNKAQNMLELFNGEWSKLDDSYLLVFDVDVVKQ